MKDYHDLMPDPKCPKCGYEWGFRDAKPHWYRDSVYEEWPSVEKDEYLEWFCNFCGYIITTKTADSEDDLGKTSK